MRCTALLRVLTPRAALKVLALPPSAQPTQASIKKAYIQQALLCHPDLNPTDPKANENFQTLAEALRVALQALELTGSGSRQGGARGPSAGGSYDSQTALESLRRSILAYQAHHDAHTHARAESSTAAHAEGATPGAARREEEGMPRSRDPFFTPSLEYVSSVCHEEAVAMRRVQTFCESLPSVLCGSRSAALFEAVAFFHTHYVASMAECVMRFSKNLPVIVRRVVRNRKQFVRYQSPKSASGIGTGSRPREQRIEDMAMKPLVLMGALVFDVPTPENGDRATAAEQEEGTTSTSSSSTCGVSRPDEIEVTKELTCVIYPTDSIGGITEKLNTWEAASFRRLKLELAIVDATALIANLVGLEEAGTTLSVPPHLHLSFAETERVLLTVQKVSCDLCLYYDDHENFEVDRSAAVATGLWLEKESEAVAEDDAAPQARVAQLIAECRVLAREAVPLVKDNVLLTWTKDTVFVDSAADVSSEGGGGGAQTAQDGEAALATESRDETRVHVHVARHFSCCEAETVAYGVSVDLSKEVKPFLLRLRAALRAALRDAHQSHKLLGDLVALRDSTVREEFIPTTGDSGSGDAEGEEAAQTFRYRGPIFCFPRLYNINAVREQLWWQRLHDEREYVATHAAAMNAVNVFYDCLPYDPSRLDKMRSLPPETMGGWVGDTPDGSEDTAVLAPATLDSASAFRDWLEDVVEQSSLSREVHTELDRAGIGYITRDPTLPLTNYLSFVRLFVAATAVRGVLETRARASDGDPAAPKATTRTVTASDVGLSITVGYECGVRDGGQLLIPWYMDPNVLLSLLAEATPTPQLPTA